MRNQKRNIPNVSESLRIQLIHHDFEILVGNTILKGNYPNGIAYNVAELETLPFIIQLIPIRF